MSRLTPNTLSSRKLRTFRFYWQGREYSTDVPEHWPEDSLPEICALRLGLSSADIYEFCGDCGQVNLMATGRSV